MTGLDTWRDKAKYENLLSSLRIVISISTEISSKWYPPALSWSIGSRDAIQISIQSCQTEFIHMFREFIYRMCEWNAI